MQILKLILVTSPIFFGRLNTAKISANKLGIQFVVNKVSFNKLETNFLLFSSNKKVSIKVKINDIEMVYASKFQGV